MLSKVASRTRLRIDKLKYALRQPFAQQKQLSTLRIQRLGSRAHNKEKEKNDET